MEDVEKLNAIKDRITVPRNNKGIYFGRVPRKEWEWFTNWCDEEFEGDYGIGLKWLCQGYMPPIETELMHAVEELQKQVEDLQMTVTLLKSNQTQEKKVIKTLSGKIIKSE